MANEMIRQQKGGQIVFADHVTDFSSGTPATPANSLLTSGTPTTVQIDLTSVAASGSGRQSAKTTSLWSGTQNDEVAPYYRVDACVEFAIAPTDGGTVDFYWAGSPSATAGVGNPGTLSGTDATFTGTTGTLGQLQYIGSLVLDNALTNIGHVGYFQPEFQYGMLVVVNNGDQALGAAMDETHIVATPYTFAPTE